MAKAKRQTSAAKAQEANQSWTRFFKETKMEMKKVIWPTRREMITYTIVVLVFVIIMTAFIAGIDILFAKGVLWLFG